MSWKNLRLFRLIKLIKKKREEKGYSQECLAVMIGYERGQFVSNMERGLCSIPNNKLRKIAVILDIGREELMYNLIQDVRDYYEYNLYSI